MLTKEELKQIRDSLEECNPEVEVFNWGPTLEFAKLRKSAALALLNRELRKIKEDKK